jgi:hypothetical protein
MQKANTLTYSAAISINLVELMSLISLYDSLTFVMSEALNGQLLASLANNRSDYKLVRDKHSSLFFITTCIKEKMFHNIYVLTVI